MRKRNLTRKLIMSVSTAAMTAVTLGTTTYAWFARNGDAVVEPAKFNLESAEGLRISIDGENYSQDITLTQLKEVIKNNTGKEYDDIKYNGVTLKYDDNGNIEYDENGVPKFSKDALELITDGDGNVTKDDVKYNHILVDADKSDYLAFDIYFMVDYLGKTPVEDYDLVFAVTRSDTGEATGIYGNETTLTLHNRLSTMDKDYKSGEVITYNPVDAMRLGIVDHNKSDFRVFEQNIGLGSKAVENDSDDRFNPNKNAMYTYYNSNHPFEPFKEASKFKEDTIIPNGDVSIYEDNVLASFVRDENGYNTIHMTFLFWLEGWDADFLEMTEENATNFNISLAFELRKH